MVNYPKSNRYTYTDVIYQHKILEHFSRNVDLSFLDALSDGRKGIDLGVISDANVSEAMFRAKLYA
jgi:hypothetical protein